MSQLEKFQEYLDTAASQIRWKRARPALARELRTHLLEQYDACEAAGLDEEAATAETLRQMGDAVEVGTALDRAHRPKPRWGLLVLTGVLAVVGLVVQYALGVQAESNGHVAYSLGGQAVAVAAGIACMLGIYFLDYTVLVKRPWRWYTGAQALSFLGWCMLCREGLQRFYALYLLLLMPVAYALAIYALRGKRGWGVLLGWAALLPMAAMTSLSFSQSPRLLLFVPNLSLLLLAVLSGLVLLLLSVAKGWFGGNKKVQVVGVLLPVAVLGGWLGFQGRSGILRRLTVALHPETDPDGAGFLAILVRGALEGSKWLGKAPDGPNAHWENTLLWENTDFVLTWVIHNAGWLAGIALLLPLIALLLWGFFLCRRQQGMLGRLLGTAVLLILTWQTVLYVTGNLGFLLLGNVSLPLLSYGKSFQLINLTLLGLLLSVLRGAALPETDRPALLGKTSRIRWRDGELVISFRRAKDGLAPSKQ